MKSEKGEPVFTDNIDAILANKIIEHSETNSDQSTAHSSSHQPDPKLSRKKITFYVISTIVTLVLFFIILHRFRKKT